MRYSADGSEEAGGAGGKLGAPPHAATATPTAAIKAATCERSTIPPSNLPDPDEYWRRQMLTIKTVISDHPFAASYCLSIRRYNTGS